MLKLREAFLAVAVGLLVGFVYSGCVFQFARDDKAEISPDVDGEIRVEGVQIERADSLAADTLEAR